MLPLSNTDVAGRYIQGLQLFLTYTPLHSRALYDSLDHGGKLPTWGDLTAPRQQDTTAELRVVSDVIAISNSSAATLTRIEETLRCILVLLQLQATSNVDATLRDKASVQDEQVCSMSSMRKGPRLLDMNDAMQSCSFKTNTQNSCSSMLLALLSRY